MSCADGDTTRTMRTTSELRAPHPTEGLILDPSFGTPLALRSSSVSSTPSPSPPTPPPPPPTTHKPCSCHEKTGLNSDDSSPRDCRRCGAQTTAAASEGETEESATVASDPTRSDLEKGGIDDHTSPSPAVPPTISFPDGGWRAWLVVAGAWCVSFTTWGYTNAFGVSVSWYENHQLAGRSPSDIAWIGSTQLAFVLACAVISGKAFDAGYIKYLLVLGTCLYAAGLFGLAYATTYTQIFLAQGVACGMAAGILFLPAVSAVSHYFRVRRATALGFLATGSSVGGVVYPLLLNHVFPKIGFPAAIRASGYLTVGLLVIACLTIDSRLPPRKKGPIIDVSHFKDPAYSIFVFGECLIMWGLYLPYFYTQTYALQHGVDETIALYSLSFLNAASLFGRVIPNWLADTYGPFTILIPNCMLSGIFCFAWLAMAKSNAGTVIFCIAYGFTSGAYVSMMPACIASITPDMSTIGIRIAMAFLVIAIPALTGTPINGAIVSSQGGSYVGATVFSGIMIVLGSCVNGVAWWLISKKKGTKWV